MNNYYRDLFKTLKLQQGEVHSMNVGGERIVKPYATRVAGVRLSGTWLLENMKLDRKSSKDCECCGHKHLKYQYFINNELGERLLVGSECVVKICDDQEVERIMTGVESLKNSIDRKFRETLLKDQLRDWLETNNLVLLEINEEYKKEFEAQHGSELGYYQTDRLARFWRSMTAQLRYTSAATIRTKINTQLKWLGCDVVKCPTARLSKEHKEELEQLKEDGIQQFIMSNYTGMEKKRSEQNTS